MRIIDFHTHCFADGIAQRAIEALTAGYEIIPTFDGTAGGLLAQMEADGICASVILPVATKPSQVQPINDWVAGIGSDRIIGFGAVHPDLPGIETEIDRMHDLGIRGFKFQPNWQGCRPDDPRMFPIYRAASGRMIALFHSGEELKPIPDKLALPSAMGNVHREFPDLTMVVSHLGGYLMWEEVEEHLVGAGVYLEMSCCFPEVISEEQLVRIIRNHGVERILFGTDTPCSAPGPQLRRLMSLPLTDEEKEMIAWKNAALLLGECISPQ